LRALLIAPPPPSLGDTVSHYDWSVVAPRYDAALAGLGG